MLLNETEPFTRDPTKYLTSSMKSWCEACISVSGINPTLITFFLQFSNHYFTPSNSEMCYTLSCMYIITVEGLLLFFLL